MPPEDLILVVNGGGTSRTFSANYDEEIISVDEESQNLEVIVDEVNEKLVSIKDLDSGHVITERQLDANGRFQVAGLRLRVNGSPKGKDSFTISDNLGGVGDGRNILAMLNLQNDKFASESKGNFQEIFSQIIASVGATVQSSKLNLQSVEMVKNAAANAASEMSGVNMDDEAAQLIEYQQAYQASARVLQTARELFDSLIDRI